MVVRSAEKPITGLTAVSVESSSAADETKDDAILAAGLQAARQQFARAK